MPSRSLRVAGPNRQDWKRSTDWLAPLGDRYRRHDRCTPTWCRPARALWGRTRVDVAGLAREPVGYSIIGLRRDRESREVGASVRTCRLLVLVWASTTACNSDHSFPV